MIKVLVVTGGLTVFLTMSYFFSGWVKLTVRPLMDSSLPLLSTLISFEELFFKSEPYQQRKKSLRNLLINANKKYNYFFIGDSHFQRFDLERYQPDFNSINFGVSGDTTKGVFKRLCSFDSIPKFDRIFILIGYNDLKYRSVEEIERNYIKILDCLQEINRNKIVLLSLLPVSINRKIVNNNIQTINQFLKKESDTKGVHFLDLHRLFVDVNNLQQKELFLNDQVHLNAKGYSVLNNAILSFEY